MAAPAAVLSIIVEARTAAATASLGKTQAQLAATGEEATAMNTATAKASRGLKTLGTVAKIGAAAGVAAFVIEAKKSVETTQDLTKTTLGLQKNLGLSAKAASEWAGVLKARGADTTKAGMAFKTFATQVSAAGHGSASAIAMFKELGFSQKDIQKSMTDTQFALGKVSDGLQALPAGADKATFSGKLFGRGWATVAPILRDGSAAMQEQLDTVEKYGGVLEGKTLKQQEALLANIRENKIAWQGFQVEMAKFVTPALNDVSDQFQRIAKINADPHLTDTEKWSKIAKIVQEDMHKALGFVLKLIPQIASQVGQTAPKIAEALVQGFLNADVWGKLALGTWLFTKLGLTKAILKDVGKTVASAIGIQVAEGEGAATAGTAYGRLLGPAIGVAAAAAAGVWFAKKFDVTSALTKTKAGTKPEDFGFPSKEAFQTILNQLRGMSSAEQDVMLKRAREGSVAFGGLWIKAFDKLRINSVDELSRLGQQTENGFQKIVNAADHSGQKAFANWVGWERKRNKLSAGYAYDLFLNETNRLGDAADAADRKGHSTFSNWTGWMQKTQKGSSQSTEKIHQTTLQDLSDAAQGGTKGAHRLYQGVSGNFRVLAGAVQDGLQNIKDNTNKSLGAFGAKKLDFRLLGAGTQSGASTTGGVGGPRAQSGMAMVPGLGSGDKVHLQAMVEPGEGVFVLNRNAMGYLQALNNAVPRFAQGGIVAAGHLAQRMGLTPSENPAFGGVTPGVHAPGSYHYKGLAIDVSGGQGPGSSQWRSYDSAVRRGWLGHGLAEEFYDLLPNYVKNDQIVPGQIGGHSDHIHVAILGHALGVSPRVARQILKGGTATMRGIGQGALDMSSKAANAYIGRRAPTTGGEAGFIPGGGGGVLPVMNTVLRGAGLNKTAIAAIMGNSYGESSWNPAAINPSNGGGGLWGFLVGNKSIASLKSYAAARKKPWTDVATQTNFMLTTLPQSDRERLNREGLDEATIDFLRNWEGAYPQGLSMRLAGAHKAAAMGYQKGGVVKKMAKGGRTLGQALAGTADAYHTQHLHPGHGAPGRGPSEPVGIPFSVPKGWSTALKALGSIRGDERKWAELVDIGTRHAGFPSSEAGTDMGPGEQKYLIAMNRNLLGDYTHERNVAVDLRAKMMKFLRKRGRYLNPKDRAWIGKRVANLKGRINELQGITGGGGLILDVQETLAGLKAPLDTATVDNSAAIIAALQSQLQGTQQALGVANVQGPVLGAFAGGGAVASMPSVVGSSGPVEVHNHFPDALAFLGDFVTTTVRQNNKQTVSAARRSIG